MADIVKQFLDMPIQLADQVAKTADEARLNFKQDCAELKSKAENLASLLRQAAGAGDDLYRMERPTFRIIDETEQVLKKSLVLVQKCRPHGVVKRVFTIIPTSAFRKMSARLENSIEDVSWLLRISISASANDSTDEYVGLPPMAINDPIACLIWEQIAIFYTGSQDDRSDAAASLVSFAKDNDRYRKLIIEEGGIGPLLKLVKEGEMKGQENAARAIGVLGHDPESVQHIVDAGVCSVFAKILKESHMKVQAVVAWAVSELATHYPKCQNIFGLHNVIRLLIGHLAFETVQEHSITSNKATLIHGIDNISKGNEDNANQNYHHQQKVLFYGTSTRGRELEEPATKAYLKAMAARALSCLAAGNSAVCHSITESRALLCFAVLLEKGPEEVQYNSAMALMEITAVAEQDAVLRKSAFKPNSPVYKAIIEQLLKVIEQANPELLIPCIKAIGNLAKTFPATETRMIWPLVQLLDDREAEISKEACIALTKFVSTDNFLHLDHAKAIMGAEGAMHIVLLVYFGEQIVRSAALLLLSYIALHVPDSKELARLEVLNMFEWVSRQTFFFVQDEKVQTLLQQAKGRLELYQSRGSRGFH